MWTSEVPSDFQLSITASQVFPTVPTNEGHSKLFAQANKEMGLYDNPCLPDWGFKNEQPFSQSARTNPLDFQCMAQTAMTTEQFSRSRRIKKGFDDHVNKKDKHFFSGLTYEPVLEGDGSSKWYAEIPVYGQILQEFKIVGKGLRKLETNFRSDLKELYKRHTNKTWPLETRYSRTVAHLLEHQTMLLTQTLDVVFRIMEMENPALADPKFAPLHRLKFLFWDVIRRSSCDIQWLTDNKNFRHLPTYKARLFAYFAKFPTTDPEFYQPSPVKAKPTLFNYCPAQVISALGKTTGGKQATERDRDYGRSRNQKRTKRRGGSDPAIRKLINEAKQKKVPYCLKCRKVGHHGRDCTAKK